jgi:hypothetical protein
MSVLRIYVPKVVIGYRVRRKQEEGRIDFFINSIENTVEPLVCEGCYKSIYAIYLCNAFHILCSECYFSCECGKNICRKCFPYENCPSCNRKIRKEAN